MHFDIIFIEYDSRIQIHVFMYKNMIFATKPIVYNRLHVAARAFAVQNPCANNFKEE